MCTQKSKNSSPHPLLKNTPYIAIIAQIVQSDLTRFTGNIKYPLPSRKATAIKLGKGGNGFVFAIFHNGKEYAVKKVRILLLYVHTGMHIAMYMLFSIRLCTGQMR